jgi:hypothetical protein
MALPLLGRCSLPWAPAPAPSISFKNLKVAGKHGEKVVSSSLGLSLTLSLSSSVSTIHRTWAFCISWGLQTTGSFSSPRARGTMDFWDVSKGSLGSVPALSELAVLSNTGDKEWENRIRFKGRGHHHLHRAEGSVGTGFFTIYPSFEAYHCDLSSFQPSIMIVLRAEIHHFRSLQFWYQWLVCSDLGKDLIFVLDCVASIDM